MPKDLEAGNVNTILSTKAYVILAVGFRGSRSAKAAYTRSLTPHALEA